MPTAFVNGIDVYYDDSDPEGGGARQAVVLITGLGGVGKGWGKQIELFSADYRTIVPDHRGTGQSSKPDSGYIVENLAVDVAELLRELDCGPAHIVGSSTGGAIAQVMALDHRDVVRSITVASSWVTADDYFRHQFWTRKRIVEEIGISAYTQTTALFLFSALYIRDHYAEVERWCDVASTAGTPVDIMTKRIDMILAFDQSDRLGAIDVPTLVLVGEDDICTPPYYSEALALLIPGAQRELLPGGHLVYKEHPEAFHSAVTNFLGGL